MLFKYFEICLTYLRALELSELLEIEETNLVKSSK